MVKSKFVKRTGFKKGTGKSAGDLKQILMILVGAIVAIVLLASAADQISLNVNTFSSENASFTLGGNATTNDLTVCGSANISDVVIYNTDGNILFDYGVNAVGNYTTEIAVGSDGLLNTRIILAGMNSTYATAVVEVTCDFEPRGYVSDGGSRSMLTLVVVLGALGIVVFVIAIIFNIGGFRDMIKSGRLGKKK